MLVWLVPFFLVTALAYASVGFGGGSTYTALLVLGDVDYRLLPSVSLACNIAVVAGASVRHAAAGLVDWRRMAPLCLASAPMAWLGGMIAAPERLFTGLLGGALLASAVALFVRPAASDTPSSAPSGARFGRGWSWREPVLGGMSGALAGLVGIGGGIFLAPVLYLMRWDIPLRIAAAASVFILVNSVAGLGGQIQRLKADGGLGELVGFWPLLPAVLIGGQIGVWIGRDVFDAGWLRRATALLVLIVALRLLWRTIAGG